MITFVRKYLFTNTAKWKNRFPEVKLPAQILIVVKNFGLLFNIYSETLCHLTFGVKRNLNNMAGEMSRLHLALFGFSVWEVNREKYISQSFIYMYSFSNCLPRFFQL